MSGLVTCPYNGFHKMLPTRLAMHLTRCSDRFSRPKLARCPFNTTHVVNEDQLDGHEADCPNRPLKYEEKQPEKGTQGLHEEVEADEDWDAEAPADTYNPVDKLIKSLVIVNPKGNIPSERKAFRLREQKRWKENEKLED